MTRTLEQILPEVEKPARYLGGERNSVSKDHGSVRVRAVLAFPDVYEIGMSHLGLRILYSVLNEREDMLLERCFAPWPDMEKALRDAGIPLCSLETRTPLSRFDVVGFSLQYELGFTNVLMMLDLAGIPFRASDRDERHPLVIAGGPVVFSPEPVADFFDLFLVGDGEEAFPLVLERYAELREREGHSGRGEEAAGGDPAGARLRILAELAKLPGVYVPRLYRTEEDPASGLLCVAGPDPSVRDAAGEPPPFPVRRATLDDLNRFPFPSETVVPHAEIVHDRVSIELARGCTEGCRFCQAGTIYRPVRERTAESIIDAALDGLEKTGYDEVSLTSLSPADYSCLGDLVEKIMDRMDEARVGVSVSSLRPYGLTEKLAAQIGRVKKSGFTIAPEAGTQRLRDVLNKGITEEHILQAANNAFGAGWDLIKTYFMIGLPTETEEDLLAMLDLCEKIYRIGRHRLARRNGGPGGSPRIHFSASSHVPKPHAPFQWARMETAGELYSKQRFLAARLRNPKVRFKRHHVETSVLECVMSRGDRRLGAVIERAYAKGCRFDGWTELFRWESWQEAFAESGVAMEPYLAELPLESRLPWDHIDTTVLKEFLVREWKRALKAKPSPACEKPYRKFNRPFRLDDKLICYDCGCECDLPHITGERVENRERQVA
ncbi:MAG TPA: TIGR03960 family B12-binding radical SAM protein, partial [Candidatus Saccharimonadales bacterium]|nr:TIGR03960 family B12-binding radical SAM protein [Candidatus Saccharimonadales bacterium]